MKLMWKMPGLGGILSRKEDFPDKNPLVKTNDSSRLYVSKLSEELTSTGRLRTARAYRSTLNSVLSFTGTDDISLQEITRCFVKDYEAFLQKKACCLNTISFYMRNLRAILNKAVVEGLFSDSVKNLFSGIFTGNAHTDKRAINKREIQLIRDWDGYDLNKRSGNSLHYAKLYFLFSFYMRGMSFIDMAFLKKSDMEKDIISYTRKKTGQMIHVQITPELRKIIFFFEKDTRDSAYILPIIRRKDKSEQMQYQSALKNYNNHLKIIQSMLGIDRKLTGYVARHSWATIAKHMNIPIEQISESLGHTNIKTTMIYLAAFNQSILHKVNLKVTV